MWSTNVTLGNKYRNNATNVTLGNMYKNNATNVTLGTSIETMTIQWNLETWLYGVVSVTTSVDST